MSGLRFAQDDIDIYESPADLLPGTRSPRVFSYWCSSEKCCVEVVEKTVISKRTGKPRTRLDRVDHVQVFKFNSTEKIYECPDCGHVLYNRPHEEVIDNAG